MDVTCLAWWWQSVPTLPPLVQDTEETVPLFSSSWEDGARPAENKTRGRPDSLLEKEAPDRLRDKVWQTLLHEPHIWSQGFTGYSINNYNHYLMAQDGPGHGFYTRLPSYLHLTTTDTEAPSSRRPPLTASRSLSILSSPSQRPACVCPCVFILVSNDL